MKTRPAMAAETRIQPQGLKPVSNTTLSRQVCEQIVEAIASGAIQPGQRLTEARLALELAISRVPVREAMNELRSQGILVEAPQRGLQVATFDREWAEQLYNVRLALETSCADLVAKKLRAEPELIGRMEQALEAIRMAAQTASPPALNRADIGFHDELYGLAASPLLSAMWAGISRHVLIVFPVETSVSMEPAQVIAEHEEYLAAILEADPPSLQAKVRHHLRLFRTFDFS